MAASSGTPRGLGRGLSALIPGGVLDESAPKAVTELSIEAIEANPDQPRAAMDEEALAELAQSIREHGIIQPLLVTELPGDGGAPRYRLIAGERRLRAARAAGLTRVPVTVRETTSRDQLELALIENVQREDLSALEEASAYLRLVKDFGLTQQQIAERVGCSRTKVTNRLRLLELPPAVLDALRGDRISEGHARALLSAGDLDERLEVLRRVEREGLSVRQTERVVRGLRGLPPRRRTAAPDPQVQELEDSLRRNLGTKVGLKRRKGGSGTLTIHFYSDEELDGVLERLLPEWVAEGDAD